MFKNITLARRINAVLALSIVFLLVLATNRIDQKHFEIAQNSVKEVYNDRVLVQDYIFSIANLLFAKRLALEIKTSENQNQNQRENAKIDQLISDFQATKLTRSEAEYLEKLQSNFENIKKYEDQQLQQNEEPEVLITKISKKLEQMHSNLQDLSKIQINESKDLTNNAQKSLDTSELLSNLEIGFLIIIGIVIQFILFYRVKRSS